MLKTVRVICSSGVDGRLGIVNSSLFGVNSSFFDVDSSFFDVKSNVLSSDLFDVNNVYLKIV